MDSLSRYRELIGDWEAFRRSVDEALPGCIWANPLRLGREDLRHLLAKEGITAEPVDWHGQALRLPPEFRAGAHWGYAAGLFQTQEEVAMLPVRLLDPRPGERILDLCAAPGNKSAQIALAMGNRGTLLANELKPQRIAALRQTIKRLGLTNISITRRPAQ